MATAMRESGTELSFPEVPPAMSAPSSFGEDVGTLQFLNLPDATRKLLPAQGEAVTDGGAPVLGCPEK